MESVSSAIHSVSNELDAITDGNVEGAYEEYQIDDESFGYEWEESRTGNDMDKPEHTKKRKEKKERPPNQSSPGIMIGKTLAWIVLSILIVAGTVVALLFATKTDTSFLFKEGAAVTESNLHYQYEENS